MYWAGLTVLFTVKPDAPQLIPPMSEVITPPMGGVKRVTK